MNHLIRLESVRRISTSKMKRKMTSLLCLYGLIKNDHAVLFYTIKSPGYHLSILQKCAISIKQTLP